MKQMKKGKKRMLELVNEKEKVKDENSSRIRIREGMWGRMRRRRQRANRIMKEKVQEVKQEKNKNQENRDDNRQKDIQYNIEKSKPSVIYGRTQNISTERDNDLQGSWLGSFLRPNQSRFR